MAELGSFHGTHSLRKYQAYRLLGNVIPKVENLKYCQFIPKTYLIIKITFFNRKYKKELLRNKKSNTKFKTSTY